MTPKPAMVLGFILAALLSASFAEDLATQLLDLQPEVAERLQAAEHKGLIEIAPVHLPVDAPGDCNHYGWPIAVMTGDTIVVMHRRIPGHNRKGAGDPDETMSYGMVLRSQDGGQTWSEPYDLRECMTEEDRLRGGLVPLSHRPKFDPGNTSPLGYNVHLHSIGVDRSGAVIAINNHGVFRSEDAGATWKHFSKALREDTFPHPIINVGPRVLDDPEQGLYAFGNWFGGSIGESSQKLVIINSKDGGASWTVEEHEVGLPQYEPAAIYQDGQYLLVTRDQTYVRAPQGGKPDHKQIRWRPGETPEVIETNLRDPRLIDTVDLSLNPVTRRFEIVRSERYHMELWLWSMAPEDWATGKWKRECRLLASGRGKFYSGADGYHPAGAVIDQKRGLQHIFIYSGHPNGPAGVYRVSRTLNTPELATALNDQP